MQHLRFSSLRLVLRCSGKDEEVVDLEALDVGLRVLWQALVFSTRRRGGVYLWCSDFNRNPHSFECIVKSKKFL